MKKPTFAPITEIAVPDLHGSQLDKFDSDSIHAERALHFGAKEALSSVQANEGKAVIGADFGGDKGISQLFIVKKGRLVPSDDYQDYVQSSDGDGYLESFEKTAKYAKKRGIPIGLSWGAPLNGTKPLFHPKVINFLSALTEKYSNDFAKLLPTMTACLNDGPAGLISGAVETGRSKHISEIVFVINGGGLNSSVLSAGEIYRTEAGHVKAILELNQYSQTTPCGVFGAKYVCIERLGANKAGIEAQWLQKTGEKLRAKEIEDRFVAGNAFAGELYEHSALVAAHLVQGVANAFSIDLRKNNTAIVGHGGAFKFPHYGERIQQILEKHLGTEPTLIMTKDYTDDACLDGAALAALVSS